MHPNDMLMIGIAVLFVLVCVLWAWGRVREARRRGAQLRIIPAAEQDRAVSLADLIATAEKDKLFKRDLDRARNPGRAFLEEIEEAAKEDAARALAAKLRKAKAGEHAAAIASAVAPKASPPNA